MKHRMAVAVAAIAVAAGTTFVGLGSASAATPSAACTANGTSHVKPGLTFTAQPETTTITGTLTACTGSGGVKSGKFTGQVKGTTGCTQLLGGGSVGSGTETVTWNNGKKSVAHVSITALKKPVGTFTLTGTVKSGLFANHKISGTFAGKPNAGANCGSVPVTTITFSGKSSVS
jgi:hypothetical protein